MEKRDVEIEALNANAAILRQSSERSYEDVVRQLAASAGNMGEKSSVIPDCLRGRMNMGPCYIRNVSATSTQPAAGAV